MLTLCAIAYDEQELLPGMLSSVYGLVNEIVKSASTRALALADDFVGST